MGKKWLNNKNVLRIISFIIAFVLWSYVIITQDPERTARIDSVEVICGLSQFQLNEGLSIISKSHETVSFSATGSRSLVTGVSGTYYAKLNLDHITAPGKYSIVPAISKPESVIVNSISPTAIDVYVDKYVSSLIPVKVHTVGALPSNVSIVSTTPTIEVSSVTVPSLILEEISYIGATLDLSQVTASGTVECPALLYNEAGNVLTKTFATIGDATISVEVVAENIKNVPVYPTISDDNGYASGLTMTATPQNIDIYGAPDILANINFVTTDTVYLYSAPTAKNEFYASVVLPQGVHLAEGVSNTVTIKYK